MKTVAVFFGGRSPEHDVSIVTALGSVIRPLQLTNNYRVIPIYIAKDGTWFYDEALTDIAFFQSKRMTSELSRLKPVSVTYNRGMHLQLATRLGRKDMTVDVAFPALHGTDGEDGSLMGLLEMMRVPYVGCGVSASAVAMDKVLTKRIAAAADIDVVPYVVASSQEFDTDPDSVVARAETTLEYPMYVKPAHLGSSIGITQVQTRQELTNGLELAAYYDETILVEQAVENLVEVTLPIIGHAHAPRPALLERPKLSSESFFDFQTKYLQGGKGKGDSGLKGTRGPQGYSEIPAQLEQDLYDKAVAVGLATYTALGCSGIARVDMLIDTKTRVVYCNEVNPMPGSLYAHNWRQSGLSGVELVEELIRLAEERHSAKQQHETTFQTNFLQQF